MPYRGRVLLFFYYPLALSVSIGFLTAPALTQVAAQLGAMRDENRKVWEHLAAEKKRSDKLVGVVGRLWEVINSRFPGSGEFVRGWFPYTFH
jgi:hypothetical protein